MQNALSRLDLDKEKFRCFFDSNLSDNVLRCLEWKFEDDADKKRMRDSLRQLAETGFVPLMKINDPVAKVISLNNVGRVVKKSGIVVGLRTEVWEQTKFENGIVPSKQSMRLVIAERLKE